MPPSSFQTTAFASIVLLCFLYKAHVCASQASLSISLIPAGASILLDNEDTGYITPHSFSQEDQGVHTITLSAEGIQDTSFSFQWGDENLSVEFILFRDKKGQAYFKETVNMDYMPNCPIEYYYFIPYGFEKQAVRPVIITLHGTQGSDGNDDEARRSTGKMLDLWVTQKPLEPGAYRNVRNIDGQETGFAVASVRWWYDISCWEPNSDRNDRLSYLSRTCTGRG